MSFDPLSPPRIYPVRGKNFSIPFFENQKNFAQLFFRKLGDFGHGPGNGITGKVRGFDPTHLYRAWGTNDFAERAQVRPHRGMDMGEMVFLGGKQMFDFDF